MRLGTLEELAVGRDNNFNLLRMLAATGVLVSHAYPITRGPTAEQPFQAVLNGTTLGTVSVYVFFAISGFFIARSFDRPSGVGTFLAARLLRLFPALLVVLLVTVAVAGIWLTSAGAGAFWLAAPEYVVRNMGLFALKYNLPGVFADNPVGPAINGSLWTLQYEVICYAGVLVLGVAGLLTRRAVMLVLVLGFLVAGALSPEFKQHDRAYFIVDLGLPFVIGAAFYAWRDRVVLDLRACAGLAAGAALVLVMVQGSALAEHVQKLVFVPALVFAVFCFGFFRSRALGTYNRLGDYSYGLYIYAFPAQQLLAQMGVVTPLENMAGAFVVALACALLSWHVVEAPTLAMKPGRRLGAR